MIDINGLIAIFAFMLVSTVNVLYIIKPETVTDLIIGQWFMLGGIVIITLFILVLRVLKEWER
jgi:hypothetical protein